MPGVLHLERLFFVMFFVIEKSPFYGDRFMLILPVPVC